MRTTKAEGPAGESVSVVVGLGEVGRPLLEVLKRAHRVEGVDLPASAAGQAEWCGGEVVWEADDLAVIRAVYD